MTEFTDHSPNIAGVPAKGITHLPVMPAAVRYTLAAAVPVLLVLLSVRLVMTPVYLQIAYARPGFPEDFYGFSQEDRLNYAPYALNYLLNGAGIHYLGDLVFPDGTPLYNERELRHMEDVKVVTRAAYLVLVVGLVSTLALLVMAVPAPGLRPAVRSGLRSGAVITLAAVGAIIVLAVAAWDTFFTAFHNIFFESGTWRFLYSDTLIRLFPEAFWFDAALTIGGLTTTGALVILLGTWQWGRTSR